MKIFTRNSKLQSYGVKTEAFPPAHIDAFSPILLVSVFFIIEFVIPYGYLVINKPWERSSSYVSIISIADLNWAFGVAVAFFLSWCTGYAHGSTLKSAPYFLNYKIERTQAIKTSRIIVVVISAIVIYYSLYFIHPARSASSRMELTSGVFGSIFFLWISVLFALLWISCSELLQKFARSKSKFALLSALIIVSIVVLAFFPLGGRGRALVSVLYFFVIWHYLVSPLSVRTVWTVFFVGNLVVVLIAYIQLAPTHKDLDILDLAFGLQHGRNFDRLLNLAVTLRAFELDYTRFHYGSAFVADILGDLGIRFSHKDSRVMYMTEVLRMPSFLAGFPPSRPGEFYMAFGLPGVLGGGYLLGLVAQRVYRYLIIERRLGILSIGVYFTFVFTGGFVQQTGYVFNKAVLTTFSTLIIIPVAILFFGYRIKRVRKKNQSANNLQDTNS